MKRKHEEVKIASRGLTLVDKVKLLLINNFRKFHETALWNDDELVSREALKRLSGTKLLSDEEKNHYFSDTAIFTKHRSVARMALAQILVSDASENEKANRVKHIAAFTRHEPVAHDAFDYLVESEIDDEDRNKHIYYVAKHSEHKPIAERTLQYFVEMDATERGKIPHFMHIAKHSKHDAVRKKAMKLISSYKSGV
jgi:hypothetical protein